MGYVEDWNELLLGLQCFSKATAKKRFKQQIRYSWGGMCAYCREKRATTVDHVKPKSKGGSSFRSNLIPCCVDCNHSKGSEDWLEWYSRQEFYNNVAKELIEEWISNKRFIEEELDECTVNNRATVCSHEGEIRSHQNEPPRLGENRLAPA